MAVLFGNGISCSFIYLSDSYLPEALTFLYDFYNFVFTYNLSLLFLKLFLKFIILINITWKLTCYFKPIFRLLLTFLVWILLLFLVSWISSIVWYKRGTSRKSYWYFRLSFSYFQSFLFFIFAFMIIFILAFMIVFIFAFMIVILNFLNFFALTLIVFILYFIIFLLHFMIIKCTWIFTII